MLRVIDKNPNRLAEKITFSNTDILRKEIVNKNDLVKNLKLR